MLIYRVNTHLLLRLPAPHTRCQYIRSHLNYPLLMFDDIWLYFSVRAHLHSHSTGELNIPIKHHVKL